MPDFAALRRAMVDGQIRTSDVTDWRILSAMLVLPRERFVPANKEDLAYLDRDIPLSGQGRAVRWLLKPMLLAKLFQAADISESDHVLDVGCTSGYSTALLGRLAGSVIGLEEDTGLAKTATRTLAGVATNVTIESGPMTAGWVSGALYDVIVLEGSVEVIPQVVLEQLKQDGRLVCIMGQGPAGKATVFRSEEGKFSSRSLFDASAPLLPGFVKAPEFVF